MNHHSLANRHHIHRYPSSRGFTEKEVEFLKDQWLLWVAVYLPQPNKFEEFVRHVEDEWAEEFLPPKPSLLPVSFFFKKKKIAR